MAWDGAIFLWRKSLDSRVFSDEWLWRLWCWCLLRANWKTRWKDGREIKPGQFITGRGQAADQLNVSGSKWLRGMQRLQEWGQIRLEPDNLGTLVTICNWESYQKLMGDARTTSGQQVDNERTADEQRVDTIEEVLRKKKGKETGDVSPEPPPPQKPKPQKFDPKTVGIPPPLDTQEFREAWLSWINHRAGKKKPLTEDAVSSQLKRLAGWGLERAIDALVYSTAQGWEGIYEEKKPTSPKADAATKTAREEKRDKVWEDFVNGDS